RTVGDPHRRAVEDVAISSSVGARAHRHDIRTGIRLRHCKRAHVLARRELREIALLLLRRAVAMDLVNAEVGMRAVRKADGRRAARDFLHGDAVREVTEPCPAVFLGDGDAEDAVLAEREVESPPGIRDHAPPPCTLDRTPRCSTAIRCRMFDIRYRMVSSDGMARASQVKQEKPVRLDADAWIAAAFDALAEGGID